jgi:hypothetical protein
MESLSIRNPDSTTMQDSDSDTMSFYTAKSFDESAMEHQCQLAPPPLAGLLPTVRPASVPSAPPPEISPTLHPASVLPHLSNASESTTPVHASSNVETV